jgi:hypothetical protein
MRGPHGHWCNVRLSNGQRCGERGVVMTGARVTEAELVTLIEETGTTRTLLLGFGPGRVSVLSVPGNRWALLRLAELRGIEVPQGAQSPPGQARRAWRVLAEEGGRS